MSMQFAFNMYATEAIGVHCFECKDDHLHIGTVYYGDVLDHVHTFLIGI